MRKRRLSAVLALILALSMSFSSFAEESNVEGEAEVATETGEETGEEAASEEAPEEDKAGEETSDEGESGEVTEEETVAEEVAETGEASDGEETATDEGGEEAASEEDASEGSDGEDTTGEEAASEEEAEAEADEEEALEDDETAEEEAEEAEEAEEGSSGDIVVYDAVSPLSVETAAGVSVTLSWDEGTFTEDPIVVIADVDEAVALSIAEEALAEENVEILSCTAVDITFYYGSTDTEPVQPLSAVTVTLDSDADESDLEQADGAYFVHQHEDEDPEILTALSSDEVTEADGAVTAEVSEFSINLNLLTTNDGTAAVDDESTTPSYLSIDTTTKTITVSPSDSDDDNEIQEAINYIYNTYASSINADEQSSNQTGKTVDTSTGPEDGWTIIVNSSTYSRFTVHSYLDYLTIEAADGAEVTINVLDGSSSPAESSGSYPDVGGVSVRIADHVTLDGLTFSSSGNVSSVASNYEWLASAVNDYVETTEKASNLVIKNCTFKGAGTEIGVMIAGATAWEIDSCTFDNFSSAISFMLDNTYTQAEITNNTITNCDDAVLESYAGGSVPEGTSAYLTVTGNTITGTASEHTRVCIMNEYKNVNSLGTVTISGNTFEHANILLDCISTTASEVYASNTIGECSWVLVTTFGHVSASITDADKVVTFYASTELGYWELTSTDGISEADLTYIKRLITTANASGATTLTIDMSELDLTGSSLNGYLSGGVKHLKTVLNWVTTTSVTVTKAWDDEDDADGIRPDSVTVELCQNGESTGKTVTLSEDNDWTATFSYWSDNYKGLPIHSSNGTSSDYTYTVVEDSVSGYSTSYAGPDGSNEEGWSWTVTNTHEPEEETTTTTTTTTSGSSSSSSSSTATEVSVVLEAEREPEVEEEIQEVLGVEREVETIAATGDDSNILFWLILMLAAGAGIGGILLVSGKRSRF